MNMDKTTIMNIRYNMLSKEKVASVLRSNIKETTPTQHDKRRAVVHSTKKKRENNIRSFKLTRLPSEEDLHLVALHNTQVATAWERVICRERLSKRGNDI